MPAPAPITTSDARAAARDGDDVHVRDGFKADRDCWIVRIGLAQREPLRELHVALTHHLDVLGGHRS